MFFLRVLSAFSLARETPMFWGTFFVSDIYSSWVPVQSWELTPIWLIWLLFDNFCLQQFFSHSFCWSLQFSAMLLYSLICCTPRYIMPDFFFFFSPFLPFLFSLERMREEITFLGQLFLRINGWSLGLQRTVDLSPDSFIFNFVICVCYSSSCFVSGSLTWVVGRSFCCCCLVFFMKWWCCTVSFVFVRGWGLCNRGDTEATNSSKILCSMSVYVLFYVNLCQNWFYALWIICGLMTCVQSK